MGNVVSICDRKNIEFSYRGYVLSYNAETKFLDLFTKSGWVIDYCKIENRAEVESVGKRGVDRLILSDGGCEAFPHRRPIYDSYPKHRPITNPYEGGWREIMEVGLAGYKHLIDGTTNTCTEKEFVADYCRRSKSSWSILRKQYVPMKCACGDIECRGWAMVSNSALSIKAHNDLYSPKPTDSNNQTGVYK